MARISLYRRYRPQTFDDVVGQNHIDRTLRNAIAEGAVAHAYLFTGPRGTGKTTTARLLAKALLCENGPTAEPDATCEQCIEVAEGRHPDVREIDAASNNGVEAVREEIIGRVAFAPTRGRYKVYIIDEVHMLSTAAFNALLKTLEEPPPNVVFILATTHPHKVPETIQSRCQRFDFHRISIDDIISRLRIIADFEGFTVPDAALSLIARHASGGMRDAITVLDQLASFTGGNIALDDVEGLVGEVDSAQLFEIAGLVARRDIAGCFRWVSQLVEGGTDLSEFVRTLTGHVRDLYLYAAVGDGRGVIDRTADEMARIESQVAEFGGPDRLARVLDLLGELAAEMRWSSDPRLSIEVALTRMARPQGEMSLEALAERVELLELALRTGAMPQAGAPVAAASMSAASAAAATVAPGEREAPAAERAPASEKAPAADKAPAAERAPADAAEPAPAATATPEATATTVASGPLDLGAAKRGWAAALIELKRIKPAQAGRFVNTEVELDTDGVGLVIEFPADGAFMRELAEEPEMKELVRRVLGSVFGTPPPFRYQVGRGAVRPAEEPEAWSPPARTSAPSASSASAAARSGDSAPAGPSASASPGGPAVEAEPPAVDEADLEHLLVHGLGAQIVGEHQSTDAPDRSVEVVAETPAMEQIGWDEFDEQAKGEDDQ